MSFVKEVDLLSPPNKFKFRYKIFTKVGSSGFSAGFDVLT